MKTYLVDAFTQTAFKGNPAAVCLLNDAVADEQMQLIANELGFSETVFVEKLAMAGHHRVRYFSPKMEIPLCGHATLAAAKVSFEIAPQTELCFHTLQGLELSVRKLDHQIVMEFPVYELVPASAPAAMLEALGITAINHCCYNRETKILLLEIDGTETLASLRPNFRSLLGSHDSINGVLVTARSDDETFDFHSRYFWPWSGTDEDPVTGGTHTFLAKYWGDRLSKTQMRSFQSSARTGFMELELQNEKLLIKGQAVIVLEGRLV